MAIEECVKKAEQREYIVKRNAWVRRRFDWFRKEGVSVIHAAEIISDELSGEIRPRTILKIIYSGESA